MRSQLNEAAELGAILDRFLERASASRVKRRQAKPEKAYLKLLRKRFKAQAKWMLTEVLPKYKGLHLREAEGDPPLPSTAVRLETLATVLQQIKDYGDDPDLVEQLNAALAVAYATGAKEILIDVDPIVSFEMSFSNTSPAAVAWLEEHSFDNLAAGLDETTASGIASILTTAMEAGDSYTEIAAAIRDRFTSIGAVRAELIAVTEVGNAYSQGTLGAAQDLESHGIAMEKAWLTVGDDRVDPDCYANEDAGWLTTDSDFPSGDLRPLAHPRCRCVLLTRLAPVAQPAVPEPVAAG